ncbi:hypothetical protein KCU61_g137, partial [Aureobasidium melanogenum]
MSIGYTRCTFQYTGRSLFVVDGNGEQGGTVSSREVHGPQESMSSHHESNNASKSCEFSGVYGFKCRTVQ